MTRVTNMETLRHYRTVLTAATILGGLAMPLSAMAQAGANWTTERGDVQGTGYSSLAEINTSNVANLVEDFSVPTGTFQNHEGAPLVVGPIMYAETPWPNNLIAIDLRKHGKVIWTYNPQTNPGVRAQACCDVDNRGPAYATQADGAPNGDGLIIFNSLDGFVHAVDAITGALVWKTPLVDFTTGETMTSAPIIADGVVIVGSSGGSDGIRASAFGLNVTNGSLIWRAYSTGPDSDVLIGPSFHPYYKSDQGTNLGVTSWNGTNWWQNGGGGAWGYKTYDPVNDLVYYGTGNVGPQTSYSRGGTGDAKWAASIFARNPKTGQAAWAYQFSPNDNWDYDAMSENVVADIPINGVTRHVVVHADKNGYVYTLDAATGQLLVYGNFYAAFGGTLNWANGIDLKTGRPNTYKSHVITKIGPANGIPSNCPSGGGAKNWEPIAYSFQTGWFYIPAHNGCGSEMAWGQNFLVGVPFHAETGIPGGKASQTGANGALIAWNAGTGQPVWTIDEPYALYGGALATAGNLVFYATLSNGTDTPQTPTVKAVNATTGQLVWSTILECNSVGVPSTFIGPDGHQRIAIFTGTGSTGDSGTGKCPNLQQFNPAKSPPIPDMSKTSTWLGQTIKRPPTAFASTATTGYIHVFKLP